MMEKWLFGTQTQCINSPRRLKVAAKSNYRLIAVDRFSAAQQNFLIAKINFKFY